MHMRRKVEFFKRVPASHGAEYIAHENCLTISKDAFDTPAFAGLVELIRTHVEATCQSRPDASLDRIRIILDYGVVGGHADE